ncbi:hypothetical protein ACH6CV_04130 [Bacillota bacterium Meth-B3]
MEMGKLTAKLRDAVPVCLLVEGKEIKRFKNIEIPDELKKLEYQDFKFDVPAHGAITLKIMFEPGVLPEEFPQTRARRTRKPLGQEAQPRVTAVDDKAAETEEAAPQEAYPAESLPAETVEALAQALEDAQAAGEPVDALAEVVANGETIKTEIIGDEATGRVLVITMESESNEATPQPENNVLAKKPSGKGRGKKGTAVTDSANQ